jgi:hypothetical protein
MERRNPREPAFTPEEMSRLIEQMGEEQAIRLEWETRVRRQTESDLTVNFVIADDIAVSIRSVKRPVDHTWLLREQNALSQADAHGSVVAQRTSGILRVLTREPGLWPRGLSTYLYATQYLFVVESTVTLAVDKVLFFFSALQSLDQSLTWESHRETQLRVSLYNKLRQLEGLGVRFFTDHINRELRNNLAHAHFATSPEGDLLVGKTQDDAERFNLEALVDEMDKTVDVVQTSHFVAQQVMTETFLRHDAT